MPSKIEKIFLDMDGVLADFDFSFDTITGCKGVTAREYESTHGAVALWEKIYSFPKFFEAMRPFNHTKQLWELCNAVSGQVVILSSPSRTNGPLCMIQKRKWLDKYIGEHCGAIFESQKQKYAGPNKLLIDDTQSKIDKWVEAGGVGHLFKDFSTCQEFLMQFEWASDLAD